MWLRAVLIIILLATMGCTLSTKTLYPIPPTMPQMWLYTPEGYTLSWWIFEESDGSCVIEYSILDRNKVTMGHGRNPCELFLMFFHAIQKRGQET